MTQCTRPPEGYGCTLDEDHQGPCPTHNADCPKLGHPYAMCSCQPPFELHDMPREPLAILVSSDVTIKLSRHNRDDCAVVIAGVDVTKAVRKATIVAEAGRVTTATLEALPIRCRGH